MFGRSSSAHLQSAQRWLKDAGAELVRARKAVRAGNCNHAVQALMIANRRLGVGQGHLASVDESDPREASNKLRSNRVFTSLKHAIAVELERYQNACEVRRR